MTSKLLPETVHPTSPYTLQSSQTPHSVATRLPRRRKGIYDLRAYAAEQTNTQQQLQTTRRLFGERTHLHTSDTRRQAQVLDLPNKELQHLFRKFQLAEYSHTRLPPRVNNHPSPLPTSLVPHPTIPQRVVRFVLPSQPLLRTLDKDTLAEKQPSSNSTQSSETSERQNSLGSSIQPRTTEGTAQRPLVISRPKHLTPRPHIDDTRFIRTTTHTPSGTFGPTFVKALTPQQTRTKPLLIHKKT